MGGVNPRIFFASRTIRLREGQSIKPSKPTAAAYVEGSGMAVMVKQRLPKVDPPQFPDTPSPRLLP
jgi:hypothetical protein